MGMTKRPLTELLLEWREDKGDELRTAVMAEEMYQHLLDLFDYVQANSDELADLLDLLEVRHEADSR